MSCTSFAKVETEREIYHVVSMGETLCERERENLSRTCENSHVRIQKAVVRVKPPRR